MNDVFVNDHYKYCHKQNLHNVSHDSNANLSSISYYSYILFPSEGDSYVDACYLNYGNG